jgi:hypothetical protein
MAISRAQMGSQLTGNKMKKPAPKFKACAPCPNPAKCRAAGKCLKQAKKK